jgi:uncharacterized membrane protein YccC
MRRAVAWLARPPPALRFGLKLGIALSASIWLVTAFSLPWGVALWVTVLFCTKPNQGASIQRTLLRISGSAAAALVAIAIYGLFAQSPPVFVLSLCGVVGLAAYGMNGPRYQYAWLVFGFTTILILVKALAGIDRIETLSFERASMTALGVVVVFAADAILWPVRAEKVLREKLAQRARELGQALRQLLEARPSGAARSAPGRPPASPLIEQLQLLDQARDEIGATRARTQALSRIALLLEGLGSRARLLHRALEQQRNATAPPPGSALSQLVGGLEAALVEAARSLLEDSAPQRFAAGLDRTLLELEAAHPAEAEAGRGAQIPILRDVVSLLRGVEDALVNLTHEGRVPRAQSVAEAAKTAIWQRPRVDPIRLQLGMRAAISTSAVIVAMLAMGYSPEEDLIFMIVGPILAFVLGGGASTRGVGRQAASSLAAAVLLGWLIADLAIVFFFPHVQRMPLALAYPFVLATGAGYLLIRGSPLGPLGTLFGLFLSVLPVFAGHGAPHDVETPYKIACAMLFGVAFGLIAERSLWPRTAMQTFTARVAAQLELCERALAGSGRSGEEAAGLVSAYAKQLSMLGHLHAQAHVEPVERALDDQRRADLLALVQDLFDASLRAPRWRIGDEVTTAMEAVGELAPLREALIRLDEALVASLQATAAALRGSGPGPGSSLREAGVAAEAQLDALRRRGDSLPAQDASAAARFLSRLAATRLLVDRQLRLEDWLLDWHRVESTDPSAVRTSDDASRPEVSQRRGI